MGCYWLNFAPLPMNNSVPFRAISITYRKADVALREKVALSDDGARRAMEYLKDIISPTDLLIISTCNRTEVYYAATGGCKHAILHALAMQSGKTTMAELEAAAEFIDDASIAARRLFSVSLGLDSQVVGDLQIINQVKQAYQRTADLQMAGPYLHRLMHTIFFANKRVGQETAFRDGAASTSYAAVELSEELTQNILNPRVLVVGLGEMGQDVLRTLADNKRFGDIRICNRTYEKAGQMALECGVLPVPFESLWAEVQSADIIISSVAAPTPLFSYEQVQKLNIISHKFFLDLSVPRSVEPSAESIPGVLVYNIDQLQQRTQETVQARLASVPAVEAIIDQSMAEFNEWSREMVVNPTINKLKQALEQIRMEELDRYNKHLGSQEQELVDKLTKNMMQKVIKLHVVPLKAACKRGDAESVIGILNDIFNLQPEAEEIEKH